MLKQAPGAVWTMKSILKTFAIFAFVFIVVDDDSVSLFTISMGELTLLAVTATANFNPILAHFCFVF